MHGWQDLVIQILVGLLINAILGILCWIGKRELSFFRRMRGFSPSSKKNVRFLLRSRINYQLWKLFSKISLKSPLSNRYSLVIPPKKISCVPKKILLSLD